MSQASRCCFSMWERCNLSCLCRATPPHADMSQWDQDCVGGCILFELTLCGVSWCILVELNLQMWIVHAQHAYV
jgi:hypothetical protein